MTELNNTHRAHLDASAISDAIKKERGYWTVLDRAAWATCNVQMASSQIHLPGIGIPIYRLGERYTTLLRPDRPREEKQGTKKKLIKYEWPANLPLCIDVLPRYKSALRNPDSQLWFTEGAKKADALASLPTNILPANINGVWGWCTKMLMVNACCLQTLTRSHLRDEASCWHLTVTTKLIHRCNTH